jgi:subtilisin family serine protease
MPSANLDNGMTSRRSRPGKSSLSVLLLWMTALALASFPTAASGAAPALASVNETIYMPFVETAGTGQPTGTTPSCLPAQSIVDPLYLSNQGNMRQIHANEAWASCLLGSPDVVVAVVDSGVDLTNPDLVANLAPGDNFVEPGSPPADDIGHGTHVAGIIGASLNGLGVVGVAPQVKILPVRVMNAGSGTTSAIAAGIRWAADRAQIINLSLGGPTISKTLQAAIDYAIQTKGRLVVAAAGNDGDTGNQTEYPAAYPGVVAVGAVDGTGQHASFSNTGSYVMFSAPGVNITSTFLAGQYAALSGTSMASPHVAGLAGLIWSAHPAYTADQVIAAMQAGAVDLGAPGRDPVYGYGLIDAFPASSLALAPAASAASSISPMALPSVEDRSAPIAAGRLLVKFKTGPVALPASIRRSGEISALGVQIYQVSAGQEWAQVDVLRALPGVEYAEPDFIVKIIQ